MCFMIPSNKGWLRQLRPNVSTATLQRFERIVQGQLKGSGNKPIEINKARMIAYREMGFCDAE